MKPILVLSLIIAGVVIVGVVGAAALPSSTAWVQPLDARPEAILLGSTLLVLAAVLRRLAPKEAK